MHTRPRQAFWLASLVLLAAGCSRGPDVQMVPVQGTVKFTDGTVPQGETSRIVFEPVAGGPNQIRKMASGEIRPDGSFEMMTIKQGDGVIAGKYKVIFEVFKTYLGRESLVPDKYTKPETTPLEVTVEADAKPFEFELEKP
ncbi:MAG: hypothetical protein ABIK89_03420 [Planctomycetota bacterium]